MNDNNLNTNQNNMSAAQIPQQGFTGNDMQVSTQVPSQQTFQPNQTQQIPQQQVVQQNSKQDSFQKDDNSNPQILKQTDNINQNDAKTDDSVKEPVSDPTDKSVDATGNNAVTKRDIENVVSSWTGIPISKLTEDESAKLLELEKRIHKRLIDQEEAVVKVAEAVRRGRIGLASGQRPIASFIFLGPSGTGKTELAKTLAEILFGRDDAMIRLDMSEYMEKHEVAKLIGAPPGYVGYEEGGQLTEAVRAKPYSIVLLDEVEKAHPDVFNILLQLLEDGRLTDNKGNTISFKNTIVICTSNIGSALITEKLKDQDTKVEKSATQLAKEFSELSAVINNELRKFFRPELLNRYDDIVIFKPLRREDMVGIAKLGVEKTAKLLKEQGYTVSITDRALNKLAKEGYDPMYGARPLRRLIQNSLENPIALEIIGRKFVAGDDILIDYKGETNAFSFSQGEKKEIHTKSDVKKDLKNDSLTEKSNALKNPINHEDGSEMPNSPVAQPVQNSQQSQQTGAASSQIYYGQPLAQSSISENTPSQPNNPPVSNFDPLSVLGVENTQSSPNNPFDTNPIYQPPSSGTGAFAAGGVDTMVNTNNFQQGTANENITQKVLSGSQLTGSGLEVLNEEL